MSSSMSQIPTDPAEFLALPERVRWEHNTSEQVRETFFRSWDECTLSKSCGICKAQPGEECRTPSGKPVRCRFHAPRQLNPDAPLK